MTTKRAFDELLFQELLTVTEREKPCRYRLLDASILASGATLTPPEELEA
jgi:hypothetical protein